MQNKEVELFKKNKNKSNNETIIKGYTNKY